MIARFVLSLCLCVGLVEAGAQPSLLSISAAQATPAPKSKRKQRTRAYFLGPRGGCYYWNASRKVYVDRSFCN